jgi:hypothetical protein
MSNPSPQSLAAQCAAWQTLIDLAQAHPDLPGARITQSQYLPDWIEVQVGSFADLETWREVLEITPEDIRDAGLVGLRELYALARLGGVTVRLFATGPQLAVAS